MYLGIKYECIYSFLEVGSGSDKKKFRIRQFKFTGSVSSGLVLEVMDVGLFDTNAYFTLRKN